MDIIWAFAQVVYAMLAVIGLVVVMAVTWIEGVPWFQLWAADVRHGFGQYRAVRAERRVQAESVGAIVRAQQLIDQAKERMAAVVRPGS